MIYSQMNQQAFSGGGIAPPFLPLSLPSGIPPPTGHVVASAPPHNPFVSLPNSTQSPAVPIKEEHNSERDQVAIILVLVVHLITEW